jgi:hypothetical protein
VVKDDKGKSLEPGKSLSFINDNYSKNDVRMNEFLKMEYVNEKFKEILRINGEISPSQNVGQELLYTMLNLEIFEE